MSKYKVRVFEVHSWETETEADNEEEAKQNVYTKIKLGNDIPDSNNIEYSHTMHEDAWDVSEIK